MGSGQPVGSGWTINNGEGNASRVSDASAPLSPSNVLQVAYPLDFGGGSAPCTMYNFAGGRTELYVGFWWKPSSPWHAHDSGVNKIIFLITSEGSFTYMNMEGQSAPYHISMHDTPVGSSGTLQPNVIETPILPGNWYRIELYEKYSTTGSSADGIVKWWVTLLGGSPVLNGNYTNLNFTPGAGFDQFEISPTWGGVGHTKGEEYLPDFPDPPGYTNIDTYRFDHFRVSRP